MNRPVPTILVFRSARPGWSFETWLFQRLTPRYRRALTAAIGAYGVYWTSDAALPESPRRRGPQLRDVTVHLGAPARRASTRGDRSWRVGGLTLSIYCILASTGPIILGAGGRCSAAAVGRTELRRNLRLVAPATWPESYETNSGTG
jgi:hypothetical protein